MPSDKEMMEGINTVLVRKTLLKEYQAIEDEERKVWAVNVAKEVPKLVLLFLVVAVAAVVFKMTAVASENGVPDAYGRFWIGLAQEWESMGGKPSAEYGPFSSSQVLMATYYPACYSALNTIGVFPDGRLVGRRGDGTPARFIEYAITNFEVIPALSFAPPEGVFTEANLIARAQKIFPKNGQVHPEEWTRKYDDAADGPTDVNYHQWIYPDKACLASKGLQDVSAGTQSAEATAVTTLYCSGLCGYAVSATTEQWWEMRSRIWATPATRAWYRDCSADAVSAGVGGAVQWSGLGGMGTGLVGDAAKHSLPNQALWLTAGLALVEMSLGIGFGAKAGIDARGTCDKGNESLPGRGEDE